MSKHVPRTRDPHAGTSSRPVTQMPPGTPLLAKRQAPASLWVEARELLEESYRWCGPSVQGFRPSTQHWTIFYKYSRAFQNGALNSARGASTPSSSGASASSRQRAIGSWACQNGALFYQGFGENDPGATAHTVLHRSDGAASEPRRSIRISFVLLPVGLPPHHMVLHRSDGAASSPLQLGMTHSLRSRGWHSRCWRAGLGRQA